MKCPCDKDCIKRAVGCHAKCFDYIIWKKYIEVDKEKLREYWSKHGNLPRKRVLDRIERAVKRSKN